MTKTTIYNLSAYTKTGKLKKNAEAEYHVEADAIDNKALAEELKYRGYHNFRSPYVFTFIHALNDKNEEVYIEQTVTVGSDRREVTVSPITLFKELTK